MANNLVQRAGGLLGLLLPDSAGKVRGIAQAMILINADGEIAAGSQGSRATTRLLTALATDNPTLCGAAGLKTLTSIQGMNARATAVYLKLYDKATVPSNADTPRKTIELLAAAAFVFDFPSGIDFSLGCGFRLTTGIADADNTAIAAGDIRALNLDFQS